MGFNTTLVIMNDALHIIEKDPEFGAKVAQAAQNFGCYGKKHVDISSGGHCNAATVVDCHHADQTSIILVGGNMGTVAVPYAGGWDHSEKAQERMLRYWADKMGFRLTKKAKRKSNPKVLDLAALVKE